MKKIKINTNEESLSAWLAECVSNYVKRKPEDIKTDVPLSEYGLDSVYALSISGDIEDYLGISIEPTIMWDFPTIEKLSKVLVEANN